MLTRSLALRSGIVLCALVALWGCKKEPAPPPAAESAKAPPAPKLADESAEVAGRIVELATSMGKIKLELDREKAPKSVENFLRYVKEGFYAGTVFHRVISEFMIQGGGFTTDLQKKPTGAPIQNEADNGLSNKRGTVAMARTPDPHSASAQFFINVVDNPNLDHRSKTVQGWGYTVFGKVIEGMDVVDKIRAVPTGARGPFRKDCPQTDVVIQSAKIIE